MKMGVRDLQADDGNAHARSLGHLLNRSGDRPCERLQAREHRLGKIKHVWNLGLRNDEAVSLANRSDVEERQKVGVLAQDMGWNLPRGDTGEYGRHRLRNVAGSRRRRQECEPPNVTHSM